MPRLAGTGPPLRGAWFGLALAACSSVRAPPLAGSQAHAPAATPAAARSAARVPRSNIVRADYAGSTACAGCHDEVMASWRASPMRRMTRLPEDAEVRAPFDGATFRFKDDTARLETHGRRRFMRISSRAFGDHLYQVTRIIGGRYREDFAGVEVGGTDERAPRIGPPGDELILPVSYVFGTRSFRLKGYSVMVGERPGLRAGGVWNETCILCHNTAPYLTSILGALHGPGAPSYQGEVVDRVMPAERRWSFAITDAGALEGALADEIRFLGADPDPGVARGGGVMGPPGLLGHAIRTTRDRFDGSRLVEVGIGCEACHGGSREHVIDNDVHPTFEVRSPFLRAVAAKGGAEPTRAELINRACARCHQVLFTRYPYTWEGGTRRGLKPGGSHINSGEARDFLLGGCASALSCVSCHDPHGADRPDHLETLATIAGNRTCTACHEGYRDAQALHLHTRHDAAGPGSACIACHMPKKNMGLGYGLTRYHRIGSPTDRDRVEKDRPLECALCHPEKSVAALISSMESWWGKRYDRPALRQLYGDLAAPALVATLERGKAHEKAPAIHVLGQHRVAAALPSITRELANEYPLLRSYAKQAVERITRRACEVDLDGDAAVIQRQGEACAAPGAGAKGAGSSR